MMLRSIVLFAVLSVLGGCKAPVAPGACSDIVFEDARFAVCGYEPDHQKVRMVWKAADGTAFRSLQAVARGEDVSRVAFAMNAGMFDQQGAPIGLYIENGTVLQPVNLGPGTGNFHMQPNGVFWVDKVGDAHISETIAYDNAKPAAAWASQSGPMLVIDGRVNPAFSVDGPSRYVRNGVGAGCGGSTYFVISENEVSFGRLARLFRDKLGCDAALYFDGAVSSLWLPSRSRMDARAPLGPMVIVQQK